MEQEEGRPINPSGNPTFESVLAARLSRRSLLKGAATGLVMISAGPLGASRSARAESAGGFTPVPATTEDRLIVPPGYRHTVILRWGDPLFADAAAFDPRTQTAAKQVRQFGYDCDFIGYMPLPQGSTSSGRGLLGVNHENALSPLMFPGWDGKVETKTREMVEIEVAAHGFTVVEVARGSRGEWAVVKDSPFNRRITGASSIAIRGPAAGHPLMHTEADPAGTTVFGTLNNCAGGVTPWGTILTGEENIHYYFTGRTADLANPALRALHKRYGVGAGWYGWARYHDRFDLKKEPHEPNRFGWIVEIDPYDPQSMPVKRTAMGRFFHEGAATILSKDGRAVAYMGDDARFEYLYKFVSAGRYDPKDRAANMRLLDTGTLYVARFRDDGTGEWLPLTSGVGPLTEANGVRSQAEVVIDTRRSADLVGGTKMDRPEDVEANSVTGKVYAALTSNDRRKPEQVDKANPRANNKFGHIIEMTEDGGDHAGKAFRWEIFILGGDPKNPDHRAYYQGHTDVSPLANPDNFAFEESGRLWVATDGIEDALGANDGIFALETQGPERGRARRFLSSPSGAEVCGPAFTPDGRTLFVAIQHPGWGSKVSFEKPESRWPDNRDDMPPRPSLVAIYREDGGKIGT
ncbi:MAG: PhoX family phosphatase [candidate division NC10 bacterium]|nr:PhoX family phosphatase [candidate division NC10 bacterium]